MKGELEIEEQLRHTLTIFPYFVTTPFAVSDMSPVKLFFCLRLGAILSVLREKPSLFCRRKDSDIPLLYGIFYQIGGVLHV
jgi:hypothetical protein